MTEKKSTTNKGLQQQTSKGIAAIHPEKTKVVIVGGKGKMGRFFSQLFRQSSYNLAILEIGDWDRSADILLEASLVLVCVPIDQTSQVIQKLSALPGNCILADLTSIKSEPLEQMLKVHPGPVVGLHPMFGPDVTSLVKQVIIVCDGRKARAYQWLLEQFQLWGCNLHKVGVDDHDQAMSLIQALRHFNTFVAGLQLMNENADLERLLDFSSPVYRLELAMIGRLFAQSPDLYCEIIFNSQQSVELIERYLTLYQKAFETLKQGDKDTFKNTFKDVSKWFSPHAEVLFKESSALLAKANEEPS